MEQGAWRHQLRQDQAAARWQAFVHRPSTAWANCTRTFTRSSCSCKLAVSSIKFASRLSSVCTRAKQSAERFSEAASIAESFLEDGPPLETAALPPIAASTSCPAAAACARNAVFCCVSFATISSCTHISKRSDSGCQHMKHATCNMQHATCNLTRQVVRQGREARELHVQSASLQSRISAATLLPPLGLRNPARSKAKHGSV